MEIQLELLLGTQLYSSDDQPLRRLREMKTEAVNAPGYNRRISASSANLLLSEMFPSPSGNATQANGKKAAFVCARIGTSAHPVGSTELFKWK